MQKNVKTFRFIDYMKWNIKNNMYATLIQQTLWMNAWIMKNSTMSYEIGV